MVDHEAELISRIRMTGAIYAPHRYEHAPAAANAERRAFERLLRQGVIVRMGRPGRRARYSLKELLDKAKREQEEKDFAESVERRMRLAKLIECATPTELRHIEHHCWYELQEHGLVEGEE